MGITSKQKEVFDFIKNYSEENSVAPTQKEIKEFFGFKSFGSVQRYIKYLVEAGYLSRDWNKRQGLKILKDNDDSHMEIALLGNVAAGIPIEAIENPEETISVPTYMLSSSKTHYALTIQGNSMIEDHICDGDIAIIKHQQIAEQGQTVVALIDGEATIKRFHKFQNHIELRPRNEAMKPIIVDPNTCTFSLAGVLVGLIRTF